MPRVKKETQAEITQRTMEEMQTQLAQLTQAMQGLLAQRNAAAPAAAPVEEQDDEQFVTMPRAKKETQTHSQFLEQIDKELNQFNLTNDGIGVLNSRYRSFMAPKSLKSFLTG